ncbi:MAG TPA: CHAP domain-containing protein, partial [Magnetospirillaceae bacterium]|nr:CHAP domain-containing protein [Magnetospirillaceae bacterium]
MPKRSRVRILHIVTVLLTLSVALIGNARVAQADTGGYPYANYSGPGTAPAQSVWTDDNRNMYSPYRYVYRNCTDFVAWKLDTANGWKATNASGTPMSIGNGADWGGWATNQGYVVDHNPTIGSVAWWNGSAGYGQWGHVAYVASL